MLYSLFVYMSSYHIIIIYLEHINLICVIHGNVLIKLCIVCEIWICLNYFQQWINWDIDDISVYYLAEGCANDVDSVIIFWGWLLKYSYSCKWCELIFGPWRQGFKLYLCMCRVWCTMLGWWCWSSIMMRNCPQFLKYITCQNNESDIMPVRNGNVCGLSFAFNLLRFSSTHMFQVFMMDTSGRLLFIFTGNLMMDIRFFVSN
jgi:hypothetical protein